MKEKLLKCILFFFLAFLLQGVIAQEKQVSGTVTSSSDGMPLIGVSVVVKGTTRGVATDFDGNFTIQAKDGETLQFTSIGFKTLERKVTGSVMNVALEEEASQLDEVVVTGYGGTRQRAKLTNSISTVKAEVLEKGSFSNPAQALSGAVSGLRVAQTSGKPGATPTLILRGGTNLDGTGSPLVIVDGQIRGGLNDINPDDIETMEVLKDAGATAIYGARANNGVVLVTTKRGKVGVSSLNLKIKHGFNYMNRVYDFLNARDYLYWQRTSVENSGKIYRNSASNWVGYSNLNSLNNAGAYGLGNAHFRADGTLINPNMGSDASRGVWSPMLLTNPTLNPERIQQLLSEGWETMVDPVTGQEIIFFDFDRSKTAFRPFALTRDYSLSMTGGNDKGKYYASLGYFNQEGLPVGNWYKRLNATLNAEYKLKPWLTSISSFALAHATWNDNMNGHGDGTYFGRMLASPPTQKERVGGELVLGRDRQDGNPLVYDGKFIRDNNTDKFNLGQSFRLDILKGLSLTLNGYVMFDEGVYESFDRDRLERPNTIIKSRNTSASFERTLRQTYNGVLNYSFNIKNHNFDAMAGYEYYDNYYRKIYAAGEGAPTDDFRDLGLTISGEGKRNIDSQHSNIRIKSYFGRLNYDYNDKYLLSFTVRRDGYSSLIDNRWGTFPGVSAGWVITKENFISENFRNILSFAKLRASFGLNGNASGISAYGLQGSYEAPKYKGETGFVIGSLPNTGLRWERSQSFEVGADMIFFQNRIGANITFYNRLTEDKYASIPLPHSSGISGITTNNGAIQNRGIEIETNFKIIDKSNLKWDLSINAAHNRNVVVKLPYNGLDRNRQGAFEVYDGTTGNKIWVGGYQEGQRPGDIYAYEFVGIYQNEEQIRQLANNLVDESLGGYGSDNKRLYGPAAWEALTDAEKATRLPIQPGDAIWRDVNEDGKIDQFDQVKVGNTNPDLSGGIFTNFSYDNLRLSVRMDYAIGHKQFLNGIGSLPWFLANAQGSFNTVTDVRDTWTPENPNAMYPRFMWADQLGKRNFTRNTSMFVYDASYLAFREVSLTYSFDNDICKKLSLSNLEVSLTGQNLGYWTKSKSYSPEHLGISSNGYALPRTFIIGLNMTF